MPRLERKSLPEQLALKISEEIAAGVWTEHLPGYRVLGQRYRVSRPTCLSALRILEANRVVGPAEPGKMRPLLRKTVRKRMPAKLHLLVVIDSRHPPTPLDAELTVQMEDFWKAEGGEVSRVEGDLMRIRKPGFLLKKWIATSGADCLLFGTIPYEWIDPVEKSGLPCYAKGGSMRKSSGIISGSGFGIIPFVEEFLSKVLELGHRRILVVMSHATNKTIMSRLIHERVDRMLAEGRGPEGVSFSLKIPDLANPADWHDWWQATLPHERPTVVLVDHVFQGLCLHNFCLGRGIRMPQDMSIAVVEDAEFLGWLNPQPTRYRYQKEASFRHFRDWVRSGFPPGKIKVFGADFAGGKTLGPAPQGTKRIW